MLAVFVQDLADVSRHAQAPVSGPDWDVQPLTNPPFAAEGHVIPAFLSPEASVFAALSVIPLLPA